jgi:hypothetical protein
MHLRRLESHSRLPEPRAPTADTQSWALYHCTFCDLRWSSALLSRLLLLNFRSCCSAISRFTPPLQFLRKDFCEHNNFKCGAHSAALARESAPPAQSSPMSSSCQGTSDLDTTQRAHHLQYCRNVP